MGRTKKFNPTQVSISILTLYLNPILMFPNFRKEFSSYQRVQKDFYKRILIIIVVRCAFWYHLYNLKNVKNTYRGVSTLLKLTLLYACFSRFLNCTIGTKSCNASQLSSSVLFVANQACNKKLQGSKMFYVQQCG